MALVGQHNRKWALAWLTCAHWLINRTLTDGAILNHTIVPARNKESAARFFARIFGLSFDGGADHFAPVRVNETLTFLFDDDSSFKSHHYAFHVSDAEFDAILQRVQEAGLSYGSAPWSLDDSELNGWNGGRGAYFRTPDDHLLELMTAPQ